MSTPIRRFSVYYLADPRFPRHPRYVGMTSDVAMRATSHRRGATGNDSLQTWKRALRAAGVAPTLTVAETFETIEAARGAEWRLIHRWRRRGLCDCNTARDGAQDAWALKWNAINSRRGVA